MQSQLNKALQLAKKTGDRVIVFDSPESENAFVIMDLDQYEGLVECACGEDYECDCDESCDCEGHEHDSSHEAAHEITNEDEPEDDYEVENFDYASEVKSLTEEELLDKINRDIALWKESQKDLEDEDQTPEKLEEDHNVDIETEHKNKSKWAIRNEVKENADEIIEEDRHYLEEVKF